MEKGISKGNLLAVAVTVLLAVFGGWVTLTQRVKAIEVEAEIRFKMLEERTRQNETYYIGILDELKELNIKLVNKEDRN